MGIRCLKKDRKTEEKGQANPTGGMGVRPGKKSGRRGLKNRKLLPSCPLPKGEGS